MNPRGVRALAVGVAIAIAAAACATPSRRLTTRVAEDPIVLPQRMAEVRIGAGDLYYPRAGGHRFTSEVNFWWGITDRLELDNLLALRYALLDDRPADGRPARPISLSIGGGFYGFGFSSLEGFVAYPIANVSVIKHVADRWRFGASLDWLATWMQKPPQAFAYTSTLGVTAGRRSFWSLDVWATRQLTERFALTLGGWFNDVGACLSPTCDWVTQATGVSSRLAFRPWHWLTFSAGPYAGLRYRPDTIPPTNPGDPVLIPPRSVEWLGLSGSVSFFW